MGLAQIITRAFYSMHDTLTPTVVGVVMVLSSFALSLYFATRNSLGMDYASVAFATTVTTTLSTLLMMELLRRRMGGFGGWSMAGATLKILVASLVMGVVLYVVAKGLAPHFAGVPLGPAFRWPAPFVPHEKDVAGIAAIHVPRLRLAVQVGASLLIGGAAYVGMLWLLKVDELHLVIDRVAGRLRKKATA